MMEIAFGMPRMLPWLCKPELGDRPPPIETHFCFLAMLSPVEKLYVSDFNLKVKGGMEAPRGLGEATTGFIRREDKLKRQGAICAFNRHVTWRLRTSRKI